MKRLILFLIITVNILTTFIFAQFQPQGKGELETAVDMWINDNATALSTYGEINTWNTSLITDMSSLFNGETTFNDDISSWDVSNVTNMSYMFKDASVFNQDISKWDVSSVTYMTGMFWNMDSLSDVNKCAIHTSFSSNENWPYDYDWSSSYYCDCYTDGNVLDGCGVCEGDNSTCTGCMDDTACNYDIDATIEGDCIYTDGVCETCVDGIIVGNDADDDTVCDELEIVGCQDETACNYDATATDSGDCIYTDGVCETCVDGEIVDYDADDDTVCDELEVVGCQDETACNYDATATDSLIVFIPMVYVRLV